MKNIIKSIWYEILRSKMLIRMYIFFVLIQILITFLNVGDSVTSGHTSGMLADNPSITYMIQIFILGFMVAIICGEDYKDKVANYEVLSGHSRISIFMARGLMAILVGAVLTTILAVLTFLVKNPYIIMGVAFLICDASVLLGQMLSHSKSFFVSIFNLSLLTSYDGWSIYNLDPSKGVVQYYAYNSGVSSEMVIGTIVVSLIMTAIYLFMGYALFRRDELG